MQATLTHAHPRMKTERTISPHTRAHTFILILAPKTTQALIHTGKHVKIDQQTALASANNVLRDIEYWFTTHIKGKDVELSADLLRRLVIVLLRQCSTRGLNSRPTETAQLAFGNLVDFLEDSTVALQCFGEMDTAQVRTKLCLHQHLQTAPSQTAKLLLFLVSNVQKWKEWQVLVSEHAHSKFANVVNNYDEPSKISINISDLPPKGCLPPLIYF